jgi:hypothetical protein
MDPTWKLIEESLREGVIMHMRVHNFWHGSLLPLLHAKFEDLRAFQDAEFRLFDIIKNCVLSSYTDDEQHMLRMLEDIPASARHASSAMYKRLSAPDKVKIDTAKRTRTRLEDSANQVFRRLKEAFVDQLVRLVAAPNSFDSCSQTKTRPFLNATECFDCSI